VSSAEIQHHLAHLVSSEGLLSKSVFAALSATSLSGALGGGGGGGNSSAADTKDKAAAAPAYQHSFWSLFAGGGSDSNNNNGSGGGGNRSRSSEFSHAVNNKSTASAGASSNVMFPALVANITLASLLAPLNDTLLARLGWSLPDVSELIASSGLDALPLSVAPLTSAISFLTQGSTAALQSAALLMTTIISLSASLVNWLFSVVLFVSCLYSLLQQEASFPEILCDTLPVSKNQRQKICRSLTNAVEGVFVCSWKAVCFHTAFVWFTFSMCGMPLVYLPSLICGTLALVPLCNPMVVRYVSLSPSSLFALKYVDALSSLGFLLFVCPQITSLFALK
jgi:hypothetical protein